MKYLIVMVVLLAISFCMGVVLGSITYEVDPEEQYREDRDQMEYIRSWNEKRKRS